MKLIKFPQSDDKNAMSAAAEVLHQLEVDLLDGKVVGFFIAAIGPEDDTYAYIGTSKPVSRLRMGGAMQHALHTFNHGEEV